MEEFSSQTGNKKISRRKSDFVLGRRKSRGRSSCVNGLDFLNPVENLSPDQRLKQRILDSVKFAAHQVSEELSKKGDKHSLHVLVTVEESCDSIEQKLENSGILKKALQLNTDKENSNQVEPQVMDKDLEYIQESAYFNSLSEESKAWDIELLKEQKALSASEKAVERASQTTQIPYSVNGVTDVNSALSSIATGKKEVNNTISSLSHVVRLYEQYMSKSFHRLQANEHKIRSNFEEGVQGENVTDIVNALIHENYK